MCRTIQVSVLVVLLYVLLIFFIISVCIFQSFYNKHVEWVFLCVFLSSST